MKMSSETHCWPLSFFFSASLLLLVLARANFSLCNSTRLPKTHDMKIVDLPIEILGLILRPLSQLDLYRCAFVDRRFNSAAIPLLWRSPDLPYDSQFHNFVHCLTNTKRPLGNYIRRFYVYVHRPISDDECITLIKHMPQLEQLIVDNAELLTDKSISLLSRHCSQLQELYLDGAKITYRSAHHLGGCRHLKRLTLRDCENLSSFTLLPLAHCPLQFLDLSGCKWLNVDDTARDLRAFRHLRHLDIVCSERYRVNDFINALLIDEEGQIVLPELSSFSMTGRNEVNDAAVVRFVQLHPMLVDLTLMACAITDESLRAIEKHLPHLLFLDISFCEHVTGKGVRKLIHGNRTLYMIGLKGCNIDRSEFPEITSNSMHAILPDNKVDRFDRDDIETIRLHTDQEEARMRLEQHPTAQETTDIRQYIRAPVEIDESVDLPLRETYTIIQQSLDANLL